MLLNCFVFQKKSPQYVTILALLNPKHAYEPKSMFSAYLEQLKLSQMQVKIADEVARCEKSVFIEESSKISQELEYLRKRFPGKKFHKGRDTLETKPFGWIFGGFGNSKIPGYLLSLVESGIHDRLLAEYYGRSIRKRRYYEENEVKDNDQVAMTLDGGVVTLFALCAGVISAGTLGFVWENRENIKNIVNLSVRVIMKYLHDMICTKIMKFVCRTN